MPALVVAAAYRRAIADTEILFVGSTRGMEDRLIPAVGGRLALIPAAPLFGVSGSEKLRALGEVVAGIRAARRVFAQANVQLVLAFGGYTSAGALIAARSLRLRTAIYEANVS